MKTKFRQCIVPGCKNTSKNQPKKLFVHVPSNPVKKKKWLEVLGLKHIPEQARYSCCEDHFNLEEDASNWMFYKTLGKNLFMKPDVVPHLNIKSPGNVAVQSLLSDSDRKRKYENVRAYNKTQYLSNDEEQEVDSPPEKRTCRCDKSVQVESRDFQCDKAVNTEPEQDQQIKNLTENRRMSREKQRQYLRLPKQIYCLVKHLTKWTDVIPGHILLNLKNKKCEDFGMLKNNALNVSKILRLSVPEIENAMQSLFYS